jgi:hypothetical protein
MGRCRLHGESDAARDPVASPTRAARIPIGRLASVLVATGLTVGSCTKPPLLPAGITWRSFQITIDNDRPAVCDGDANTHVGDTLY